MRRSHSTTTLTVLGLASGMIGGCPLPEAAVPEAGTTAAGSAGKPTTPAVAPAAMDPGATAIAPPTTPGDPVHALAEGVPWIGEYPTRPPMPWGTWVLESGGMLPTFVAGQATFGVTADVTALVLNEDGSGRVFLRDRLTGAKDCLRTFALFDGDTLVLDFAAETTVDFEFNTALETTTFFFPVVVAERDTLGIADDEGRIALFSRRKEVPADVACGELEVLHAFDGLPSPQFFTDLVLFDGDLVYTSGLEGKLERFDLDTDTLGAPLGDANGRIVQTTQGGFFWTHCGCGGSRDAFKRTLLIVADTVSSENELGGAITMRAMAYVPTTDRLWIHGRAFSDSFARFHIVNTNGEPDQLERTIPFNRDVRGLAFDGTDLWGIVTVASQSIVRIDAATGTVLESFEPPDEDVSWAGIVFDDSHLYLLGTDPAGGGVLRRLARP